MLSVINEKCQPIKIHKYSASISLKSAVDVSIEAGDTLEIPLGVKIDLATLIEKKLIIMPKGFYNAIVNDDEDFFLDNNVDFSYKDELYDEIDGFLRRHHFQLTINNNLAQFLIIPSGVSIIDVDFSNELTIKLHNPRKNTISLDVSDIVAQITLMEHRTSYFDIDEK